MMDPNRLRLEQLKVLDSLNFHLALNNVDDLLSAEECKGAVSTVTELYNRYRSVHVELQSLLGDNYQAEYPRVNVKNDEVTNYLKTVKNLIRNMSSEKEKSSVDENFQALIFQVGSLVQKVKRYNDSINGDPFCVHDESICDKYIAKMEGFINDFYSLRCLTTFVPTRAI